MDDYELKQDIKWMLKSLREQKKLITSSKEEAEKYLNRLGVMHLFVPIEETRKSKKASKPKSKKAGKRKSAGK